MIVAIALGFTIALLGSMPMSGPLAVMFVSRALQRDRRGALRVAAGGALVEGLYALGIGLVLPELMLRLRVIVLVARGLGALVVGGLGIVLIANPDTVVGRTAKQKAGGFWRGVAWTAGNPTLLATWSAVLSTLYANQWIPLARTTALVFALGVVAGNFSWLAGVLFAMDRLHLRPNPSQRRSVLRWMGGLLLAAGVYLAVRFFRSLVQ